MSSPALLEARGLKAGYGDFPVLFGIDFAIAASETVAIIGANGAGKTTFLRCLSGVVPAERAQVLLEGKAIAGLPSHVIAEHYLASVRGETTGVGAVAGGQAHGDHGCC